ncbi:MAG: 50S ribosomal protein L29 [Bacteroidetes bacterium]|nr:50S ribosomal protein L29 [Bacteroidota bacterium]
MSKKVEFLKSLQGLNVQDLRARIQDDEVRLKKLRFSHAISPLENPMTIRALRREIAQLRTLLSQREVKPDQACH